jgi:hypothetical protein
MGRTQSGVLGNVSGKVGPVVFSSWNGIDVVKARPRFKKNRQLSEKQLAQNERFRLVGDFVKTMANLFKVTFKDFKGGMTGSNSAFAHMIHNAVTGTYPDFKFDYSKASIAQGRLPISNVAPATVDAAGVLNFQWTHDPNSLIGSAKGDDKVILVAWCEETQLGTYTIGPKMRSDAQATLAVQNYKGKTVHTWLAFISDSGKHTSPSVYTGSILVP